MKDCADPVAPLQVTGWRWWDVFAKAAIVFACVVAVLLPVDSIAAEQGDGRLTQLAAIVAGAIGLCGGRRVWSTWQLRLLGILGLLALWLILGTMAVSGSGNVQHAINKLWVFLAAILLLGACLNRSWTEVQQRVLAAWILVLGMTVSLHAVWQVQVEHPAMQRQYWESPENSAAAAGINAPAGSRERMLFEQRLMSTEPYATFSLTNSLAGFLLIGVLLGLTLLAQSDLWRRNLFRTILIGAVTFCCSYVLLLTNSRSAFLGLLGAGLWGLWNWYRHRSRSPFAQVNSAENPQQVSRHFRNYLIIAVGLTLILGLIAWRASQWDARLWSEAPLSIQFRLDYWYGTLRILFEHPCFGTGLGNFRDAYALHRPMHAAELVADPHNWMFELAATGGIPAALLTVGSLVTGAFGYGHTSRNNRHRGANKEHKPAPTGQASQRSSERGSFPLGLMDAGFLLGITWVWLGGLPAGLPVPPLDLYLVLIPLAVVVRMGLLWGSSEGERLLGDALPVIAIGLFINLLAAGGISVPGILFPMVIVAGVALSHAETGWEPRSQNVWRIAFALAMLLGFWISLWHPVATAAKSTTQANRMLEFGRTQEAKRELIKAAEVSPYDPTPWLTLASIEAGTVTAKSNRTHLEQLIQEARERAPSDHALARWIGELYLQIFGRTQNSADLAQGLHWYEEAFRQHPTDASLSAQIAAIQQASGKPQAAAASIKKMQEIDQASRWQNVEEIFVLDPSSPAATGQLLPRPATEVLANH